MRLGEGNAHLRTNAISVAREKGAIHKQPRKRDLCRAYAVKSGFTPPEGNRYLLFNSQMIAWRPHRRQWIVVTLPIHSSNPCARRWEDSAGSVCVLTTPQLMGLLATRIGEQAQDCLPSPRPRKAALFSPFWCLSLAKQTLRVFAQRACGQSARSTDGERVRDVAKVR